eukprot:m.78164 g.78164  ORF g.78164 m.78164 type:complete len:670 (-) comp16222_c0_seq2:2328-4337(-)
MSKALQLTLDRALPHLHLIAIGTILLLGSSWCKLRVPRAIGEFMDTLKTDAFDDSRANMSTENHGAVLEEDSHDSLLPFKIEFGAQVYDAVMLVALMTAGSMAGALHRILMGIVGDRVSASTRKDIFSCLVNTDMMYLDGKPVGALMARLDHDVNEVTVAVCQYFPEVLRNIATIIGGLITMGMISIELTCYAIVMGPLVGLLSAQIGIRVRAMEHEVMDKKTDASSIANEAFAGVRCIKTFGQEEAFCHRFAQHLEKARALSTRAKIFREVWKGSVLVFASGAVAVALVRGGAAVRSHSLLVGDLFSFVLYAIAVSTAASDSFSDYGKLVVSVSRAARTLEIISTNGGDGDGQNDACNDASKAMCRGTAQPQSFDIALRNVTFSYGFDPADDPIGGGLSVDRASQDCVTEQPRAQHPTVAAPNVLHSVSVTMAPGCVTALVGASGSGKSTLVQLLLRLYTPQHGSIAIGGCDLEDIDPAWLRRHVAVVEQGPVLFSGTFLQNIAFGHEATLGFGESSEAGDVASREQFLQDATRAAKLANAHEFILAKGGYDSPISERGANLSGGQRQRIAIARALMRNPSIILLDEATSALDAESAKSVQLALTTCMAGRTAVVVAHKLDTVRNADQILVMSEGKIVERGTHETLVGRKDGVYRRLLAAMDDNTSNT